MRHWRLSSGSDRLDTVFGGGLPPNGIVLIGGNPGSGKTTLVAPLSGSPYVWIDVKPDLARYAGRLLPSSSRDRSVDVDDRRTVTSTDYDEPVLFVARVALSMNGALRHVQEVARTGLDHSASPWSRLHP